MKICMRLVYQYMAIFINFSLTSNHFHPLQVENCGSNSRLVVDENDNGKLRLERVKQLRTTLMSDSMLPGGNTKLCLSNNHLTGGCFQPQLQQILLFKPQNVISRP